MWSVLLYCICVECIAIGQRTHRIRSQLIPPNKPYVMLTNVTNGQGVTLFVFTLNGILLIPKHLCEI